MGKWYKEPEKYVIYPKTYLDTLVSKVAFYKHVAIIRDRDGALT